MNYAAIYARFFHSTTSILAVLAREKSTKAASATVEGFPSLDTISLTSKRN
jgi:hypothetical protein